MICIYTVDEPGGTSIERIIPHGKKPPRKIRVNGKWAYRDIPREHTGPRAPGNAWPHVATFGPTVNVEDAERAMRICEERGCPTEYRKGKKAAYPVWRSPKHRAAWARALEYFDRDAGYGDPAPQYYTGD